MYLHQNLMKLLLIDCFIFSCVFVKLDTLKTITWFENVKGKQLTIQEPDMQQQNGGSDCGLFTIAASIALCNGVDPASVKCKSLKM